MTGAGAGPPGGSGHGLADAHDVGIFLARLLRLDPAALVRLRPGPAGPALWAALPLRALATRVVAGPGPRAADGAAVDATVAAADLRAALGGPGGALPPRCDARWRWPLPPGPGRAVERLPAAVVAEAAVAAGAALRQVRAGALGRPVAERAVRDALLDHVPITVRPEKSLDKSGGPNEPLAVPQRLIQAVVRMGFLGALNSIADRSVDVCVSGAWVGLAAPYGTAWLPGSGGFTLNTQFVHTFGHDRLVSSVQQGQ